MSLKKVLSLYFSYRGKWKDLFHKIISVFLILLFSNSCKNTEIHPNNFSETTQYIIKSMSEIAKCPNKVWPDLILAQTPYIILDKSTKKSVIISHNKHGIPSYRLPKSGEITEQYLKYDGKTPSFQTTFINGNKRVIIFLDSKENDSTRKKESSLELLLHEAFHSIDQDSPRWKRTFNLKSRFSEETATCTPRKYRGHVKYYLEKALRENTNSKNYKIFLQKAAYWHKKYTKNFPEEFKIANKTDISEGTAEFVETMGYALAKKGCQATKKELLTEFTEHYFKTKNFPKLIGKPDLESYSIGSLSSALLERNSFPDWQKKVENTTSPVQLLLSDIPPIKSPEIPEIKKGCRRFDNIIQFRRFSVNQINKMLESESYIALSINPPVKNRGTMAIYGDAGKGLKGEYGHTLLSVSSYFYTDFSKLTYKNIHILHPKSKGIDQYQNSCGNRQIVFLTPKNSLSLKEKNNLFQVHFSGERETISSDPLNKNGKVPFSLKGHIAVTKKIKQQGADLWCIK